jgi:hypothetical protein
MRLLCAFFCSNSVRQKVGYLEKRGYLVKSWRRRWFVLSGLCVHLNICLKTIILVVLG